MSQAYDNLVKTGAIGSLKRDILTEASTDVYYVAHIRRWFAEKAGAEAAAATPCTVRLISELLARNVCSLATWGKEKGSSEEVTKSEEELFKLVDEYKSFDTFPFDYFLINTELGNEWIARYEALVSEL